MAKNANILEKEAIELETKLKKAAVKEDGSRDDELLKFLMTGSTSNCLGLPQLT